MAIKIGYLSDPGNGWPFLTHDPTYHPVREQNPEPISLGRCPAVIDYVSSAFNVHVPYDFSFTVTKKENGDPLINCNPSETTLNPSFINNAVQLHHARSGVLQITVHPFWVFISDTPDVYVEQTSAFGQTNPEPIRGKFDCYKWIRPLSYGITFKYDEPVKIKRGSPIFQVKFHHPKENKFSLHECEATPEIKKFLMASQLRGFNRATKWTSVFDFTGRRRPRNLVHFIDGGNQA